MKETLQKEYKHNKYEIFIIVLFIILIILVSYMIHLLLKDQQRNIGQKKDPNSSNVVVDEITPLTEKSIIVLSPKALDKVDSSIPIEASIPTGVEKLMFEVIDNKETVIASKSVLNDESAKSILTDSIDITGPISTSQIFLKIYNVEEKEKAVLIELLLNKPSLKGRLKLNSPLKYEILEEQSFELSGSMKGFFEATFFARIKNEAGTILYSDFITPSTVGDNYLNFVPFLHEFDFSSIETGLTEKLTFEIYDISEKDGSEEVLLSVPLILDQ